jgi:ribosomal protein S8
LGVISNFLVLKNPKPRTFNVRIKFAVNFYQNNPFFKKIKIVSTRSRNFYIKYSTILLLKKVFKASVIVLSTSKGLVSSSEATNLKVGGKIMYIIT